ncbi:3-keto-disaccharide hydrolase [Flavihumibacter profundi]|uniref:3-keto-disaccharide hydrolase n=1 Tax=Flavihumibacter profundi TaxID=2716883 RepID=UPI001CC7904F|nr:DUF1080 domain-containing protein [Flavihumibacter profundi]MBZ5856863.1 DUF1080 domain-containing protein [Flavihumibacter profundi]
MFRKQLQGIIVLYFIAACSISFDIVQKQSKQAALPLFDGKSLRGWKKIVGKAAYSVEDGAIVGTSVIDSANSFLVTEKAYNDFVLDLDLMIESPAGNSGVQTRSHFGGNLHPNKVYGRQVEVDPSPRSWSGGIYDEDRREWIYSLDLNPAAKSAFIVGAYNHYKIECIGNEMKTWVNGIPAAHVIDDLDRSGFIGLQVHAVGTKEEAGHKVYFKNIIIRTKDITPTLFPADLPLVNLNKK